MNSSCRINYLNWWSIFLDYTEWLALKYRSGNMNHLSVVAWEIYIGDNLNARVFWVRRFAEMPKNFPPDSTGAAVEVCLLERRTYTNLIKRRFS